MSFLPPLEPTKTRRQLGQGYVSNAINKAAGFNRDTDYSTAAATVTQRKPDWKAQNGVAPPLKQKENSQDVPLYVPTQRVKKTEETYQPSLLSKEKPVVARH